MITRAPRRIELRALGDAGDREAARVLGRRGEVLAVIAAPAAPTEVATVRDLAIRAALEEDFGDAVLAGVAFVPEWGGGAVGFT